MTDQTTQPSNALRPLPADFAEHAAVQPDRVLRDMYNAGGSTVTRWRRLVGINSGLPRGKPNIRMPADFGDLARGMSVNEAATYFRRDSRTLRRWFVYAGITPREAKFIPGKPVVRAELDPSLPGQAAQHLRRFYANVFRADIRLSDRNKSTWGSERGLPDDGKGQFFVSGLGVLPDYEMIVLARDHGFVEWHA